MCETIHSSTGLQGVKSHSTSGSTGYNFRLSRIMAALVVATEVVALVGGIVDLCKRISDIASNLETLGGTSANLSTDIETLHSRIQDVQEQLSIRGERVNGNVVKKLETANSTLLKAESDIQDLKTRFESNKCCFLRWWLSVKLCMNSFSAKLDERIRSVDKAFDDVIKIMKDEIELKTLVQQDADLRPTPTKMSPIDDLYVPIVEVQNAVIAAIEKLDGPPLVLLHGGVGKGKSTLARYVHKFYENRTEAFQYVLLVNCAGSSKFDPSNKQYEILRRLSPASLTINPGREHNDFNIRIAQSLHEFFLSGSKMLIILDDVSDRLFIAEMLKASQCRTNVKYFVTSQNPDLCNSCRKYSFPIPMSDPNDHEAKTILATLVGLKDNLIPEKLQRFADQMIKATGGNPLALSCLASNFANNQDKTNVRAWNEAYGALCHILGESENMTVLWGTSDDTPPRSLWAAMQVCINCLQSQDAKDILFLMYACEGESVPEEVLRILHATAKTSGGMFSTSIAELWSRELLKASTNTIAQKLFFESKDQIKSKSCSMLTTLKLYIDQHMASDQEMRTLFSVFRGEGETKADSSINHERGSEVEPMDNRQTKVAIALCALYFDRDHTDKNVKEAATWACEKSRMNDWNATIKDRRRKAIEPLIWLLDQTEIDDPTWRESHIHCLRQVFLRYICFNELDVSNICILLKLTSCPSAQLAMLVALADILEIEEIPLLKSDRVTFVQELVHILKSNADFNRSIQGAAWKALEKLSWKASKERESDSIVRSTPDLLPTLERTLRDSDTRATVAASILWSLSYDGDESISLYILTGDGAGLLDSLVKSLSKDGNPKVQVHAAWALNNLAWGQDTIKLRILGEHGALEGLVGALSKIQNPKLQEAAACALWGLATGGESIKLQIAGADGTLAGLVKSLSEDENPELQGNTAFALSNLAYGLQPMKTRILDEAGALEGLVGALSKDRNPKLQKNAAGALANLSMGGDSMNLKLRILDEAGALEGLVGALSKDRNPTLQKNAAGALANLSMGGDSTNLKLRILDEAGALEGLVGALSKDRNPKLQKNAARALSNLAMGGDSTNITIVKKEGALAGLLRAYSKGNNMLLQKHVAAALVKLASTQDPSIKIKARSEEGWLAALTKSAAEGDTEFRKEAQRALENLEVGKPWG